MIMAQHVALILIVMGSLTVAIGLFFATLRAARKLRTDPFLQFEGWK